ncbi:MAG: ParM/StbA family protein [Coleofasciculaceae cyanobacterium RL_1_1]|nr:ParM/StbA family protein [Coleofasciculaceae cyanobacterium RL_1_1]
MTTSVIRVAFDPGSSLTKIIYSVDSSRPKLITMASETLKLDEESVGLSERDTVGILSGVNDAYLKYRKRDDRVYIVGQLANEFSATVDLSQSKYESAIPKFLAAIGAILNKEQCDGTDFEVIPLILLPYNEFASQDGFVQKLEGRGKRYYFRDRKICLSFPEIVVMPEGGGYLLELKSRYGAGWLEKRESVCVLMIGHRNASFLTFSHGRLNTKRSATSDWGFVRLVDRAIEHSSGQNRNRLTRDIYELGDDISANHPVVQSLTRTKELDNMRDEAAQLADAIQLARKEYWQLLRQWMSEIVPRRVDSLTIAGGGASYLHSELFQYFNWAEPNWHVIDNGSSLLRDYPDSSLQHRVGDVYSGYLSHFKVSAMEAV